MLTLQKEIDCDSDWEKEFELEDEGVDLEQGSSYVPCTSHSDDPSASSVSLVLPTPVRFVISST
jgi:hypothetical protein